MRYVTGYMWEFLWFRVVVCWLIIACPLPGSVRRLLMTETPWLLGMQKYHLSIGDYASASVFEKAMREGIEL
jgi:hypothetical protein